MARSSLGPGLDGILVVDKPIGPTSHDLVGLVRRLAATKRVGHGGTLDPFASGVLPLFLGNGGELYDYVPALNAGEAHAALLADLIGRHARGWPATRTPLAGESDETRQRALRRGAAR